MVDGRAARGERRARRRMVPQVPGRTRAPATGATTPRATRHTLPVTAILGGLAAAVLWAAATLCSSRSSRMLGSRVVLAWVMVVGTVVGLPLAIVDAAPARPSTPFVSCCSSSRGCATACGLMLAYAALTIGKVSIVAPIVATEGAVAAVIAVALGDTVGAGGRRRARRHRRRASSCRRWSARPRRPGRRHRARRRRARRRRSPSRREAPGPMTHTPPMEPGDLRKSVLLAIGAALIFGVGLVASGRAAAVLPPVWVAFAARAIGVVIITLPILLSGRLRATRAALPLLDRRRGRRDARLDGVGLGRAREHPHRRGHGQPVRGDQRGRRVLPVRRAAGADPGGRRRPDHRRASRSSPPRPPDAAAALTTGYTPAS